MNGFITCGSSTARKWTASRWTSKADARKVIDAILANITAAVATGEEVSLNGFGKFKLKDTPERQGRNPSTGEAITIAASRKLTFAPAKAVRDRMNGK